LEGPCPKLEGLPKGNRACEVVCVHCVCRRVRAEKELQHAAASEEEKQNALKALQQQERDFLRLQRQRLSAADFEPLTIIGRGAFGEVCALH
jgi:hypothetical protein